MDIAQEQRSERLRQEKETFEQRKRQDQHWFVLSLLLGAIATLILPILMIGCFYILMNHEMFTSNVVTSAGAVLFVDVTGFLIASWKIVMAPRGEGLRPVTPMPGQFVALKEPDLPDKGLPEDEEKK